MDIKSTAEKFFQDHPDEKDGVVKAWYAYHAPHFREMPDMPIHNFTNGARWSECVWCGRSRETVRHDEESGRCACRPEIREIKDVLEAEGDKFMALSERGETEIPKLVRKLGLSGSTLAKLHTTYGFDPETVADHFPITRDVMEEYERCMERESELSRAAQVREIIAVKS